MLLGLPHTSDNNSPIDNQGSSQVNQKENHSTKCCYLNMLKCTVRESEWAKLLQKKQQHNYYISVIHDK